MNGVKTVETREIFDKSKVDVGDIVEWNEYNLALFTKPKVAFRNIGIVTKFEPETLHVKALDSVEEGLVWGFGLPVERDDITVVRRNPLNEMRGSK